MYLSGLFSKPSYTCNGASSRINIGYRIETPSLPRERKYRNCFPKSSVLFLSALPIVQEGKLSLKGWRIPRLYTTFLLNKALIPLVS